MDRTFIAAIIGITLGIILAIIPVDIIPEGIIPVCIILDIVPVGILLPGMLLADIVGVVNMRSWTAHMIRQGWLRPPFAFISTGPLISKEERLTTAYASEFGLNKLLRRHAAT